MSQTIRFCLVLHNHQPVGNFDGVFEQAYQDSYRPFLDLYERYDSLPISLHTSGPLMEWLDQHHPDYLDRLARLVQQDRIEIVGGPFYEPILTMIPTADRIGQITSYTRWLEDRLGAKVQGMWMPERVWEQGLTRDLVDAGMRYTVLDDFHFRNAGLKQEQLDGYYVTEDEGRLLSIFPGSERLRYLIPFGEPQETIDYLRQIAEHRPGSVVVFGDDGEKFGTWPETHKHVYEDGWLARFLDGLVANQDWIKTTTLAEAIEQAAPLGKIYLPDGSYREMTEWVLPSERQIEYENLKHDLEHDERWPRISNFIRGGFWRNFRVKYPEANEMYTRMMMVSRRLQAVQQDAETDETIDRKQLELAQQLLYRGQCNCSYWHGAFGGIYLPHLRNAVYQQLIDADNHLDAAIGHAQPHVEGTAEDYNYDARQEVCLKSDRLLALIAPAAGGQLYELDVRSICHNLLATLSRRPEAYHRKVLAGSNQGNENCASIHDRVIFKQEGLDQKIQYDHHPRKSLLDHFYDDSATLESVSRGEAAQRGDFLALPYEAKLRRNPGRVQVLLTRQGFVDDLPITITKGLTLEAGSNNLEVAYRLEGLPTDRMLHFAVELNFAGLPAGADDRFFYQGDHQTRRGQLGTQLDLTDATDLGMVDQWLGVDVHLGLSRPSGIWTFPIETVSQSEGGFELVHQSVVVQPHWHIRGDAQGRWSVTMDINIDTSLAESRQQENAEVIST